jgi:hypothetical protein
MDTDSDGGFDDASLRGDLGYRSLVEESQKERGAVRLREGMHGAGDFALQLEALQHGRRCIGGRFHAAGVGSLAFGAPRFATLGHARQIARGPDQPAARGAGLERSFEGLEREILGEVVCVGAGRKPTYECLDPSALLEEDVQGTAVVISGLAHRVRVAEVAETVSRFTGFPAGSTCANGRTSGLGSRGGGTCWTAAFVARGPKWAGTQVGG